jgi:hypothetical protein
MKASLSRQRQELWDLWRRMGRILKRLGVTDALTPGSLYWMGRKCGKAGCACARGELHHTWVVTRSEAGRARLYTVGKESRDAVRGWTGAYRIYQRSRARLVRQWGELLRRVDALAEARRVNWPGKGKAGRR